MEEAWDGAKAWGARQLRQVHSCVRLGNIGLARCIAVLFFLFALWSTQFTTASSPASAICNLHQMGVPRSVMPFN